MANDDPISRLVEALDRSAPVRAGAAIDPAGIAAALTKVALEQTDTSSGISQQATAQLSELVDSLSQARSIQQIYVQAQTQSASAISQTSISRAKAEPNGGREDGGIFDATVSRFFLSPIASAIMGLFGRRNEDAPPPLPTYALPSAIRINAGYSPNSGGASRSIDYGQDGLPRVIQPATAAASPQITVQVQALDSRSFLDHSEDIARAVRHAVLNSHALSDVVSEL